VWRHEKASISTSPQSSTLLVMPCTPY
jgi:hypothetical protein